MRAAETKVKKFEAELAKIRHAGTIVLNHFGKEGFLIRNTLVLTWIAP